MKEKVIALVKGDGSGPDIMGLACDIVQTAALKDGIEIIFEETPMGWNAYEKYKTTLPDDSLKRALEIGTIFFGGVGDPKFDATIGKEKPDMMPEAKCLLELREKMGLLLNFRPVIFYKELDHLSSLKSELIPENGIFQGWIRFLLEDSYFGKNISSKFIEFQQEKFGMKTKDKVTGNEEIISDSAYFKKSTIEKYARAAFKYAEQKNLPVISVDKSNVMSRYVFWRKIVTKIHDEEFPNIPLRHQYVDSANALLFTPEKLHGVIMCGNEHGDILSDGAAASLGSMGLMCSSAVNPDTGAAMFESGSGTAPTLAGKDIANPIGKILTGAMMLQHIGAVKGALAIENAVRQVLKAGFRTKDIASSSTDPRKILGTIGMSAEIVSLVL